MSAVIAGLAVWSIESAARACSCLPPKPPAESADNAEAVFEATPTSKKPEGTMAIRYTFEVTRVFKGDVGSEVSIVTANNSAACGRDYDVGTPYLVYASTHEQPDTLSDNLCSRTQPVSAATEDMQVLGRGSTPGGEDDAEDGDTPAPGAEPPRIEEPAGGPAAPPPTEPSKRGCSVGEMPHGGGIAAIGLLAGLLIARRRRSS